MKKIFLLFALLSTLTASAYDTQIDGIYYNFDTSTNQATVTYGETMYPGSYTGDIAIPGAITYNGVTYIMTAIGDNAFRYCSGLTSIEIPNSVTSIGDYALAGCSGLKSVTIPNSVKEIGYGAFYNCSGLTSIEIPNNVTSIGDYAFSYCTGLTSVAIPNNVTSIGSSAFSYCSSLTSIGIPNSVTEISNDVFHDCHVLTSVTIPNSVTTIGNNAFYNCYGLTSVIIPNSVTMIGSNAFTGCQSLTSIVIPNSVTSIGEGAFTNSSNLTSVTIGNSVTEIGDDAFMLKSLTDVYCYAESVPTTGTNAFYAIENTTLHVPASSLEAYKATSLWNEFGSIVALDEEPAPEGIAVNEDNFPDESFRNWVLSQSYGEDGILTEEEITGITRIDVRNSDIHLLKGIEYFTAITYLSCAGNYLSSLDLTNNTDLQILLCSNNNIIRLDLSKNMELTDINCSNNLLASLDVTGHTELKVLECYHNQLTSLDVTGCTALATLRFHQNNISGDNMDSFIMSLPNVSSANMCVINNEGENNVITVSQIADAKKKGWKTLYTIDGNTWKEYEGNEPEVNKCATPTIALINGKCVLYCETEDVKYVCNLEFENEGNVIGLPSKVMISVYATKEGYEPSDSLTLETSPKVFLDKLGDINGDGEIGMPDVMFIVNYILNGKFPDEE